MRLVLLAAVGFAGLATPAVAREEESQRYGLFNLLDHRSVYGSYWFPEPLQAPEMDVDDELRIDWLHTENRGAVVDEVKAEIEKSFGLLTLELEVPYERETMHGIDPVTSETTRSRSKGIG